MKQNKKFELNNLYFVTGVGWGGMPAIDSDFGRIGYRGIGEAIVPPEVIERLTFNVVKIGLLGLLVECIKYNQEVEFEEI